MKSMILFIAPNPHKVKKREGFLQRVWAVDEMFSGHEKRYYDDIQGDRGRARALAEADLIYVHSIYSAKRILVAYPFLADKIITDLHGAVPEEEEFSGDKERSIIMSLVEEKVFKFGMNFVAVSEAMVNHMTDKYPRAGVKNWIVLPIFNAETKEDFSHKTYEKKVVYAGGAQKWQNVDKMVDVINRTTTYKYTILTHQPEAFDAINPDKKTDVIVKTVPSDEVASYYAKASLGFLLRDDDVLNRVACPTKLIEYMCSGVVPVVLSPNIGDAKVLGYQYILYKGLLSDDFDAEKLRKMAKNNGKVLHRLRQQAESGVKDLKKLAEQISKSSRRHSVRSDAILELLSANSEYEAEIHKNWALRHENARLETVINELRVIVNYYNEVKGSRTWKLVEKARRKKLE